MSLKYQLRQKFLDKLIQYYGPYLGAGVKVKSMGKDYRSISIYMPLTFYNKNYVGTQFGGSLYSMADPWYMLMLIKNLGRDYIVWDKAATIRFLKPGKGTVHADFLITQEIIDEVKAHVDQNTKMDKIFKVQIKDDDGVVVAEIDKTIYIRRKGDKDKLQGQV